MKKHFVQSTMVLLAFSLFLIPGMTRADDFPLDGDQFSQMEQDRLQAIPLPNLITPMIAAGDGHTLFIMPDGTLWAWGFNVMSQIGNGKILWDYPGAFHQSLLAREIIPVPIGADQRWVSIATGHNHSLAINSEGKLWVWGYYPRSSDGHGAEDRKIKPTLIGRNDDYWVSIASGYHHSLGIKKDGGLWAWGECRYRQPNDIFSEFPYNSKPIRIGQKAGSPLQQRPVLRELRSVSLTRIGKVLLRTRR